MDHKPTLYLMVGLPGSGKTTWAKQLAAEHGAIRFTPDEWHIFLFGDDYGCKAPENLRLHDARHEKVEELMWSLGRELLRQGVSVILDYGFWAREQREKKRREAEALGAHVQVCYQDVPLAELKRRIGLRNQEPRDDVFRTITEQELESWSALFQSPDPEEIN